MTLAGPSRYRLGVDIGGTFTDLVLLDTASGALAVGKTLTTPDDPSRGVRRGIEEVLAKASATVSEVDVLIHGTTLVANAVIERKGVRTAFVATRGFRDLLVFRREFRYDIYDLNIVFPAPLVPRRDSFEVAERVTADGAVLEPLTAAEAERVARIIGEAGYEAVAVCLLHSYANAVHEQQLRDALARWAPEVSVSLSSEVLPQLREYERACATAMNAFVAPVVGAYLARIDGLLRDMGFRGQWYVMASNGKILGVDTAARYPIYILESGPAAGALAAAELGRELDAADLLSFDMGGTTAKACLVTGTRPTVTSDFEVARVNRFKKGSGLPVKLPVIDMIEIGAGGGSIARVNALGLIEVGPESAGAAPGPACYGLGGPHATVTDANVVLGLLDPDFFLGGDMTLDAKAAWQVLEALGRPLGLDATRAALGVHRIVTANMAEALRTHAAEKGVDYRRLPLVAFGGGGPLHAYGIARALGIGRVVVPRAAGALSALGFLTAPLGFDFVRSQVRVLEEIDPVEVEALFADLEKRAHAIFAEAAAGDRTATLERKADLRYRGQGFEVTVPLRGTMATPADVAAASAEFDREYGRLYGRTVPGIPIEVVSWRLGAWGPKPVIARQPLPPGRAGLALKGSRSVVFGDDGAVECHVYDRYRLAPGEAVRGPAVIEERECTMLVGPRCVATVDPFGAIVMEVQA